MSEKNLSRNVAIALGIIVVILLVGLVRTVADYTSIINGKDSTVQTLRDQNIQLQKWLDGNKTSYEGQINNLIDQKNTLQNQVASLNLEKSRLQMWLDGNITLLNSYGIWLEGNKTLLAQTQIWLLGNITHYESEINSLNSQITDLQSQTSSLNSEIDSLNAQIASLESQIADLTNQINTLNLEKSRLQMWLDGNITLLNSYGIWLEGNKTLLAQTQIWLLGNITHYESEISTLNSQIAGLQSQISSLNSQIESLDAQIAGLENQITDLTNQINTLKAPKLIKVDLKADDVRRVYPWDPDNHLHVYGYVCNVGTDTAYNCKLHVVAYQSGEVKAIDTYISLGTLGGESWTNVDTDIYYSGSALISWTITPEWTATP